MAYANGADMGNYKRATDNPGPNGPDVKRTRSFSVKYGFCVTADQELTDDLGIFTRLGWSDGHTETWEFTPIDQTATVGLALKGKRWSRPDDVIGVAGIINGLSKDHRDYLAAGGRDFNIGDGRLPHYAPEEILEAYYNFKLTDHVFITPDFQLVLHPAYNSDRGPVSVGGIRVHAEF